MPKSDELTEKLKQSDPDIQRYVAALEAENAKLHLKIAKLEVQNLSAENRIAALQQTQTPMEHILPPMQIVLQSSEEDFLKMSEKYGYNVTKK